MKLNGRVNHHDSTALAVSPILASDDRTHAQQHFQHITYRRVTTTDELVPIIIALQLRVRVSDNVSACMSESDESCTRNFRVHACVGDSHERFVTQISSETEIRLCQRLSRTICRALGSLQALSVSLISSEEKLVLEKLRFHAANDNRCNCCYMHPQRIKLTKHRGVDGFLI